MAKKKNTAKKHKFKHVEAAGATAVVATATESPAAMGASLQSSARSVAPAVSTRDFSYVSSDLRRIGVMAVALVGVELVLYFVLVHTSVGASIYNLVKV
ncbi:MAG TPA: hypothetical protein VMT30_01155 [Candidatus Saccharimonadia bacterium]|nr:hypothetical protein [Candidatus Saccharimonadia bacterium]